METLVIIPPPPPRSPFGREFINRVYSVNLSPINCFFRTRHTKRRLFRVGLTKRYFLSPVVKVTRKPRGAIMQATLF